MVEKLTIHKHLLWQQYRREVSYPNFTHPNTSVNQIHYMKPRPLLQWLRVSRVYIALAHNTFSQLPTFVCYSHHQGKAEDLRNIGAGESFSQRIRSSRVQHWQGDHPQWWVIRTFHLPEHPSVLTCSDNRLSHQSIWFHAFSPFSAPFPPKMM